MTNRYDPRPGMHTLMLDIPVFTAIRYMVCDIDGPLRGFPTKIQAEAFAKFDPALTIKYIPRVRKKIEVEEAPF